MTTEHKLQLLQTAIGMSRSLSGCTPSSSAKDIEDVLLNFKKLMEAVEDENVALEGYKSLLKHMLEEELEAVMKAPKEAEVDKLTVPSYLAADTYGIDADHPMEVTYPNGTGLSFTGPEDEPKFIITRTPPTLEEALEVIKVTLRNGAGPYLPKYYTKEEYDKFMESQFKGQEMTVHAELFKSWCDKYKDKHYGEKGGIEGDFTKESETDPYEITAWGVDKEGKIKITSFSDGYWLPTVEADILQSYKEVYNFGYIDGKETHMEAPKTGGYILWVQGRK